MTAADTAALGMIRIEPGDIIKEGWLLKQSRFLLDWRRRWIVLTKTHLCSYKQPGHYEHPTEVLPLAHCTTVKSADDDVQKANVFRVDTPTRVFLLVASSMNDKETWIGAIGRQMVQPSQKATHNEDEIVY
eukprot:Protomagalhaensia_sp_Gyna_25__3598@NODE_3234_length_668_cov_2_697933_g2710_i0_p1_GENE_NODE_3234_length_668_cov_2_697933_g2710_i0NODE_3234_length_668_cov_2_697933_g2710_i0_p1_ORF_typecomplete_len131_score11_61PH/PF00169_29/2_8e21PH_9/PF15410_6/4_1e09PH_11/PF15413_6/2_2e05PH_13/PF16652_5/4_8e06PH_8/PF15409_6/9_6e06PH_3/PF14593_6/7_4e05PH_15/PF17339_2/0_0015PH_6/PF15406_6/0_036PH_4/PF15404_6/46PH_4/PF15404_6/5_3_NODE_3234_length_668_cov_2_697933_g2710_i0176568